MSAVIVQREGSIARIVMNRPEVHNAFDDGLISDLTAAIAAVGSDDTVRAVVLTGEGLSFSAGADLNWMRGMAAASEMDNRADSLKLAKLMRDLQFLAKPTIARVNGAAYGGGVGLIACCDIAIGAEHAKFALSEVKLGLVPAVISPYVIAAIGLREARRLFLTGEVFDAELAVRMGLLHESVPADALDTTVARCVTLLAKGGPVAQHEAKRLALDMGGMTEMQAHHVDEKNAALIARLRVSSEGQSGLAAFLAKTTPPWIAE
ncbi:methylglutaconyl-CoA hydratase [Luteibacter rhizovicinus]|uniref:Methylglutaconyl-CoA hydratase n=1 Tax=Luteibacter rhizovicinus TaxID=242606 RepID=A0A4V2W3U1_9GAMM|nr:enoyl-CoA hydratase-related protein [Luteibacter rhizovicinus]TCV93249.1 methylglutaconyl-CoA hydratase [Luteibacter rhizovicinus]